MSLNGTIYCIENISNGRKYIGQTIQLIEKRINRHFSSLMKNKHYNSYLQRDYNKSGNDKFKWYILESNISSRKKLNDREIFYIKKFSLLNEKYGYNLTGGGNNITLSESTKIKISNSLKNNILISKKIIQYDIESGEFIKEWSSLNEIKRQLNYSPTNISYCCKKHPRYTHAYKFGWAYKENYDNNEYSTYVLNSKKFKAIVAYNDSFSKEFNSIKDAMNYFSFERKFIQRVLSGDRNTYKGYCFKYL